MAVLSGPVFLDTSVLVASMISVAEVGPDREILERIADGTIEKGVTAWHCLLEFYSVVTRLPEEVRVRPADAEIMVADFTDVLGVHSLPSARRPRLFRDAREQGVVGGNLDDFHIGEIARSVGAAVLVTGNVRHFRHLEPEMAVATATQWLQDPDNS